MSVETKIELSLCTAHQSATADVNAWRGRCVNHFARAERIVTDALIEKKRKSCSEPLGSRLSRLSVERASEPSVLKAIEAFEEFVPLRNTIVHCQARVLIDLRAAWLVEFETVDGEIGARLSEAEASETCRKLRQIVDQLKSRLESNSRSLDRAGTPSA